MKRILYIIAVLSVFCSCSEHDGLTGDMGLVKLNLNWSDEVIVRSRAEVSPEEADALKQKCKIRIFHNDALVKRFRSWNEIPAEGIFLPLGDNYKIKVNAGDSVTASFTQKYYEGIQTFAVRRNDQQQVDVNCNIVNTLVKVVYSSQWSSYISEAKVEVWADEEKLTYTYGEEAKTGYFILPQSITHLKYVFSGKTITEKAFAYEGTIGNVKSSTLYTLTFNPKEGKPSLDYAGGGFFKLTVDDTPLYQEMKEDDLHVAPRFEVYNNNENIDVKAVWIPQLDVQVQPSFYIKSSTPLKEATVSSQLFVAMGLNESIDLLDGDIVRMTALYNKGISLGFNDDKSVVKMVFMNSLNSYLESHPKYDFVFHAKDSFGDMGEGGEDKLNDLTFQIQRIDINVRPKETPWYEIWSKSAVVYGEKFPGKEPTNEVFFQYRKKNSEEEWTRVDAIANEDGVNYQSVKITGLEPATVYEYQFGEEGKDIFGLYEFTTESGAQFPNASFEEWSMSGGTQYVYDSKKGPMFWDSGNQGATTGAAASFGSNMTTPDKSIKNSGTYSAKLVTNIVNAIVMKVVAAGNLFIGDFIRTDGTNGVLGWGRPWDARPVAIEGYVRYTPGSGVNTSKIPSGVENTIKGGVDNGIIYAAIGDWSGQNDGGQKWPVIIKTSDPANSLFNTKPGTYTGDGIIAYGEYLMTEKVEGDTPNSMKKFRIELDYRALDRRPTSIIFVAAASKYGDYYVGAAGSAMWLDDLTLIYE